MAHNSMKHTRDRHTSLHQHAHSLSRVGNKRKWNRGAWCIVQVAMRETHITDLRKRSKGRQSSADECGDDSKGKYDEESYKVQKCTFRAERERQSAE